jgi:hypothetical protein
MSTHAQSRTPNSGWAFWVRKLAAKIAALVLAGLVFGYAYDWAAPRFYGPEQATSFRLGVLHGALMPVALPSLLMGNDVPIYATSATGRIYKLGYIAGINLCGLLFFGLAFRQPKRAQSQPAAVPPPSQ